MARPQQHFEGELCERCGENEKHFKGYTVYGSPRYRGVCQPCHTAGTGYRRFKGDECELCGYHPLFVAALDVHHRDGDHFNNDPDNLMTLCATCHRELEATIREFDGHTHKAERWFKKFLKKALNIG